MRAPRLLDMYWHDVCFAHFRADPDAVARTLPAGVEVDTFAGDAWLSVVPFHMRDVKATFLPVLRGFARVPELNLRTYVRVRNSPGVWFFSLDAASPLLVRAARLTTGLPYFDSVMNHSEAADGTISYGSVRTWRGVPAGEFAAAYRARSQERSAEPGSLDHFLVERYRFFSSYLGRLVRCEVAHPPWRFADAEIAIARNTLGAVAGIELGDRPDRCVFSRGVRVSGSPILPLRRYSPGLDGSE